MADYFKRNFRSTYRPTYQNWEEDRYVRDFENEQDSYGHQRGYAGRDSGNYARFSRDYGRNYNRHYDRDYNEDMTRNDYARRRFERGEDDSEYYHGPYERDYGRDFHQEGYYGRRGREFGIGSNYPYYRGSEGNRTYRGYGSHYPRYEERDQQGERNWWDKTTDEVASWFGDDDAERRRRMDKIAQYKGKGPRGYRRSDERIKEDINDRLSDDPYVDATDIEVQVQNGEVTVTGIVRERDDKRRAEYIAEMVSGVVNVENRLRVGQTTENATGGNIYSGQSTGSDKTKVRQEVKY